MADRLGRKDGEADRATGSSQPADSNVERRYRLASRYRSSCDRIQLIGRDLALKCDPIKR
jgi:hypothetical protein